MLGAFRKGLGVDEEFKWDDSNNVPGVEIPGLEPVPKGQPISGMVNQTDAKALQDMGFSKNVSEKALLLTSNKGV